MPWEAMSEQDLRREFVVAAIREGANVRQLCRRFGISAKTGYKWLSRYRASGEAGLVEISRRPRGSPSRVSQAIEAAVLEVRGAHPAWGGRKIKRVLERTGYTAPAASTVTQILRRNGIELGATGGHDGPWRRFEHEKPNDLWQMDFKGHVPLADRSRLHPLTVLDDHSRFAVVLKACADERTPTVRDALIAAFRRYGLPRTLITDNGAPWGDGPGHPFTPLGVFLIDQGIRVAHARPYHPQTMGKDERFHRSLKAEALGKPFANLDEAARRLEAWRHTYNHERPHEAIDMVTPAERYHQSQRDYLEVVPPFDYAPLDIVRRVQAGGSISFRGKTWRLPKAFRGKTVALRPTQVDGLFEVFYRHQIIASLNAKHTEGQSQPVTHVSEQVLPLCPV